MKDPLFAALRTAAAVIRILTLTFVAAAPALAQTEVFVPGNATGCFGNPDDGCIPLVAALTVSGPGTITITYVNGMVNYGLGEVGPDGGTFDVTPYQLPLQEAVGLAGGWVANIGALIGVFVPQARVQYKGFSPVDGTKGITRIGIMPTGLRFIGTGKSVTVTGAGTLYLGINDGGASDNSGGFNVTVTGP